VFTGRIGEHAQRMCRAVARPGISLDVATNARHRPRTSTAGSTVATWVIPTNEELTIAQHTLEPLEM
jgi:acetate kinase